MKKQSSGQILAANLQKLMAASMDLQSNLALARRAKVGHTHIGRILRQESSPTLEFLDSLAGAFGVEPWELLTDSEITRERALQRMMFGNAVPDARVEQHLPAPPRKVIAMRRRRKGE